MAPPRCSRKSRSKRPGSGAAPSGSGFPDCWSFWPWRSPSSVSPSCSISSSLPRPPIPAGSCSVSWPRPLTYVCAGGVWWLALRHAGYAMRLREFAFLGIGKLFVDQALPTGGASGTVLVAASLRNRGIPLRIAFFAMLVGLFSYYSAYLASAIATFVIIWTNHRMGMALATAFAVFALVALFIPLAVIAMRSLSQRYIPAWLKRRKTVQIILLEMSEAPLFELMTLRLFLGTVAFQMAVVVLDAATLWIAFKAIGYSVDPFVAFAGMVSGSIGATIGPAPLGLGTYEGSAVAILTVLGVPVAPSLTAVIIFRGLSFWLPMLPGMWFSRRELGMHSRTRD
ncbi:MAG: hypothetical protein CTR54_17770 [Rhizobium sp.]|nr:MAG: hypothetical protein CTR54_17770 [Rhizobium sp.]